MSTFTYGMQGTALLTSLNELDSTVRANVLENKKLAILGDSQDLQWAQYAIDALLLSSVINVAKSGARFHDSVSTSVNLVNYGDVTEDNVLSNQVRRLIQDSFTLGAQITWTHPITAEVTTIDIGEGVGLGNTPPDVIYIKMGQNGSQGALTDADFETAVTTTYGSLDRYNQFTAIRWAVDTLNIVFPHVPIFLATPINTLAGSGSSDFYDSFVNNKIKSDLTIRMAKYLNCPVINIFEEMGVNRGLEIGKYLSDTIHPYTVEGNRLMGRFIANRIRNYYFSRT